MASFEVKNLCVIGAGNMGTPDIYLRCPGGL